MNLLNAYFLFCKFLTVLKKIIILKILGKVLQLIAVIRWLLYGVSLKFCLESLYIKTIYDVKNNIK